MGVVYRALDPVFGRRLAVKVLLARTDERPDLARRFLDEARLTGRLQHPGVPPVHDQGVLDDGRPYFTMKLIEGRTLDDLLKERPSPRDDIARFVTIFGQACQTVAYAHSQGVIHRDLKPLNVMVGEFGEVQVMDWGLAKVRGAAPVAEPAAGDDDGDERTQAGQSLGTPAYMAPEQARAERDGLDERADVFGLGAILCSMPTGQPPYTGTSALEVLGRARQGDLADAWKRLDDCGADAQLVTLARACLSPEVSARPRGRGGGSRGGSGPSCWRRARWATATDRAAASWARKGHMSPARHRCNAEGWNCCDEHLSKEGFPPGRQWAWNRWLSVPVTCETVRPAPANDRPLTGPSSTGSSWSGHRWSGGGNEQPRQERTRWPEPFKGGWP
jgi:serine/threonine protein kinase